MRRLCDEPSSLSDLEIVGCKWTAAVHLDETFGFRYRRSKPDSLLETAVDRFVSLARPHEIER